MPQVLVSPTTSTEIAPVDYNRTMLVISNADSSANLHISFGAAATTNEAFIGPLGSLQIGDTRCRSSINGISSSGSIIAKYSVLSAGA